MAYPSFIQDIVFNIYLKIPIYMYSHQISDIRDHLNQNYLTESLLSCQCAITDNCSTLFLTFNIFLTVLRYEIIYTSKMQ